MSSRIWNTCNTRFSNFLPASRIIASFLLLLTLAGCGNGFTFTGDHTNKDNYALKITPAAPILTVGHSVKLTGSSPWGPDANWTVLPAAAGVIDNTGAFTAGKSPTDGKIVAMWKGDVRYTATADLKVVAAPDATITTAPVITINAAATASVPTQPGSTYKWTVTGGTITGGQGTSQIQFTATALGTLQISATVTNLAGDSANGQKSVTVIDVPPAIQYVPSVYTLMRGKPAPPIRPVSTGGAPVSFSISPGLLPGLTFDPATGLISGTPTNLSGPVTYTITANNSGGTASATVTISSVEAPPAIAYIPASYTLTKGAAIQPIVPTVSGGPITSLTIAPSLPAGLSFDTATGIVTGTPTALSSATSYNVTASNSGGSATASLSIRVVDAPPILAYNPTTQSFIAGTSVGSITPTNTGGPATSFAITSPLPPGLSFNTATGVITGTPTTPTPTATYTVTASNSGGASNPVTLTYTVTDPALVFSYIPSTYVFTNGTAISPIMPTVTSGTPVSYRISAPLPSGLTFDTATGRISGTPTAPTGSATYTVTATDSFGTTATAPITLSVAERPPVIHYTPSAFSLIKGVLFPTLVPTNTGGPATSWTISGTLPAGLSFDSATGNISGTPTFVTPSATYTVTASNSGGTSNPTFLSFAVIEALPNVGYVPNVFIFTKGQTIAPIVPVNSGGAATSFTLGSPLPAGLTLDPATGRISGTPTTVSGVTAYTVTASNSSGSGTPLTITISVVDIPPAISYLPTYTFTVGSPISAITPTNTGGPANSFTLASTLPAGLVFNPATGQITGTPTAVLPPTGFSVTATNTGGISPPATFTLSVVNSVTAAITASSTTPLYGASVNLIPTFTNAVTATVGTSKGASDLSASAANGAAISTSAITSTRTYWVHATNAAGDSADASVTVTPQTVAVGPITPASPTRTVGSSTTFSATATGGITNGLTWTASSGAIDANTGTWIAPPTTGTATITATSKDDPTRSSTTTVNIVAVGTSSLVASNINPPYGATITLTPTFTGAVSASIGTSKGGSDISTSPVSGTPIPTAAITSPKTYWLRTTNAAGDSTDVSVLVTPQTVLVNPITPANPARTVGTSTTFSTTATGGVTNGLTWSASAGAIDANTGAWTAPATPGNVVITATSKDDPTKNATTTVTVIVAGTAALTASNNNPLYGATVLLTPTFTNAVSAGIGTSVGASDISTSPVTGVAIPTAAITSAKTYWLRTTNAGGTSIDTSVTVTPQTVAVGPITPANPSRTIGSTTTFTATATGGLTNTLTWTASAGTINAATGVWTAPATPQSVVITATAKDDTSKSATTTVTVGALPTASLAASTNSPLYGATVTLTPTFANAVGAVLGTSKGASDVSATATTGIAVTSSALTTPVTFWLRATNAAGDSVDASALVTPQTVTIGPITAASTKVSAGLTTTVKTTVSNAVDTSINWTANGGVFSPTNTASGATSTWTAPSTAGTYTITATSAANPSVHTTTTITVVALPLAASLNASNTNPLYGATVDLTPTFSAGTGVIDNGIGTVTSGTARTSAVLTVPTTFTLTVTNTAGQTATAASPLITPQTVSIDEPLGANLKSILTAGTSQAYTAAVHGALNTAVTWTATGGSFTGNTWTAPTAVGPYTLTATSVADPTKSRSTVVTVVNPPVITSFAAADPLISLNHATTLRALYTNGAGTATIGTTGAGSSDISGAAANNQAITTGNLAATKTFTLTVYNEAGNSTSATIAVTVVAGSSSPTAPLSSPRYAHTGTLLPDGRVLIAGGRSDSAPLNTSQIYDPSTAAFTDAGTLITARFGHTATLLANNTVLLTGGNSGSTIPQAELWNGAFASTGTLNIAREKHTATLLLNGQVLIVGGENGNSPVVSAELYNPLTGAFTYTAGNLNTARFSHTATLLANGKVLISGGSNGSVALNSAELFDPATGAFTVVGSMANARQRHSAVLLNDGTVAIIGGQGASAPLTSAEIFNSTTNTFAGTGSMASARDGLTATLIASGKVIVTGGIDASGTPVQASEILDPTTGHFGPTALLATARTQHTATLLQNGQILLVGGLAQSSATAGSELLDPQDGLTPVLPNATLTAPVGATQGQAGLVASVPAQTHVQYVWMITGGGSITSGIGTNAITFTMPASGIATLDVLVTSDRLVPSHARFVVTPKPVISSFSAARNTVTVGNATSLNWAVLGADSLSINQSIGVVTGTSTPVTASTLGSTIYTLTATNAGGSVTATTSLLAVAPPIASSLTAAAGTVPVGGNTTLIPIFTQGTGAINQGLGAVVSGPAYPTATISAPTTFTLTVTNAAGDTAQKSVTVGLQPVSVTGINGPAYISSGHTASYTAAVTGSVNTAVTWGASSGVIDATGHLTAPASTTQTPLTLTAASVNGGTPGTLTVQVVPLPVITSFAADPAGASYGGTTSLVPVFANGTGQIVGLGSVTSGQAVSSGILTSAKTFTLIVTNLAGDSVSQDVTVNLGGISVTTPATTSGPIVTSGDVLHYTASTVNAANTAVTWSANGGSFSGSNWTAPAPGTYTITASSVAPTGYSASATITVIAAPTITSFTAASTSLTPGNTGTTLQGVFAGGAATVNPGAITPVSGASFSTGALTITTSYTLSVSNSATVPKTVTRSVTVSVITGVTTTLPTPLADNRVGHTVTLLTDGNVLIAGGSSSQVAEKYTASSQALTQLSSLMQSVRFFHTATLMAEGKVLLAGGSDGSTAQNTAEIFDPATGIFTATAGTMTEARKNHTAALMPDGRVLLAGGVDASGNALTSSEIYDPVARTFTAAPAITSAREFATATSLQNGSVLLAGGDDTSSDVSSAQTFNGAAWSSTSALVQARTQHTATLLAGGNVFLAGGSSSPGAIASTEVFTGAASSAKANLANARFGHVANLLASGQVFLTGGTSDGNAPITSSEVFDPTQNQVFTSAALNTARFDAGSTILRNGNVFIAGGASSVASPQSSALNTVELFNPQDSLVPVLPSATLTAPTFAAAGTTGLTASVPSQNNVNFVWSVTNATITAGLNTHSITFTKGSGGPSIINVLVVSDRQVPVHSSASVSTAPSITSFTASPSTNTAGLASTLAWTVTGAPGLTLSINNGVGDVTALGGSTSVTVPAASTTYTLTATDTNGITTRSVTLNSVPAPVATALTAAANPIEKGSSTTILPIFASNGSASINNGVGAVVSGLAYPTGNLNTSTTFTLTVLNSVGTAATQTLTVNVMPVVIGAISGPANVTVGTSSAQFSASVTGAVDKSVSWSTSAGAITAGGLLTAPATAQDIVVTATANADSTQHSQLTVHVVGLPVATGIIASNNPVPYGGSTTITPTFSQGTGTIDQGISAVTSGVAYTTGTITADKTFTLTVTSSSGATASFPYTVHPQTVVVGAISGPIKVTQGRSATFNAAVTGAVDTTLTWTSAGAGSFSGNRWTAPATVGSYTLTATAVNGATNTLPVTVVVAPAISGFSATPVGINKNQSSTLNATFTGAGTGGNAAGVVTPGNLSISSGGAGVSTGALAISQNYTLTVTNDAGDTATAQTSVQVFLGAFSATSNSIAPARNLPTATLGADGNVLVAGGATNSNAADIFNGNALTFSANAATLLTGRSGQTATLLPNGLILLAGGSNGSSALATAELYNPADGSLTATGSLQGARKNHRAILLDNGKVLLVGGASLNTAELYDPVTGAFTLTSPMASVRESASVSRLPDGRILVAGGLNGSTRLASAEIFDPASSTFTTAAGMLQARALHTATVLPSGQILIAGGTGGTGPGSAELFNTSLLKFVSTGNMIQPRQEHIATLLAGGMVLLAGGNSGVSPTAIDQAELFDPSQGSFIKTDFMSTTGSPTTAAAANLLASGKVLVTGGTTNGSAAVTGSELYTPTDGLTAAPADATITAPTYVTEAATGIAAHVTAAANARYIWQVTNGVIASGQGTPSITVNMAATGNATLDVLIVTDRQIPSHGHAVVVGDPAPTITSLTASTNPVLYGASTAITPVFANATGGSVIGTGAAGSSDISASAATGVAIPVGPFTAPVQYRLTVTNRAGVSVNRTLTVGIQAIIVSAISPANPILSVGDSRTFSATVSNVTNTSIVWSATGGVINPANGAWTAPNVPGTYTIKATAAADNATFVVTTATVVALPAIQSFTASPTSVGFAQSAQLLPVFTGASANKASIGTGGPGSAQLSSTATTGADVPTGPLTTSTTYTLTVTNAAGATTSATVQVSVIQPFSATGALALARLGQTTTALPDGSVLIAGGTGAADKAEIYTTGAATFTFTQPMQAARKGHTATLLPTGQVLLAGGSDGVNALASAELYNPATHAFTTTTGAMAHARQNAAAVLLSDGRVLIVGGSNATEHQLASAEIFDPASSSFSTVATTLASPREFATATALNDGRIFLAGGFNGTTHLATAELFANGAFTTPALPMGSARSHHSATLLPSGKVLLSGGYDGVNRLSTTMLFNPGNQTTPDSFSAAGTLSQSRQDATAILLTGGKVLVAGGTDGTTPRSSADLFNPTDTSFSATGNMIAARSGAGSALLLDGTVLVDGGTSDGTTPLASAERFDPQDSLTPFQPNATVVPSVTHAVLGTAGLTATAPTHAGNSYIWFLANGTITAGQGTPTVTFTMANSGDAVLDLLVLSDHLVPAQSQVTVAADPLPALASFTASLNPVPYGGSTTLTAVFSNAPNTTLGTTGYGSSNVSTSVPNATPVAVGPLTAPVAFTITLPEVVGNKLSSTLTVNVLPVVISAVTPAASSVTAGHTQTFAATVTQAVNTGLTWSATGGVINSATGAWTAPATPGVYTIKATAAADNLTSASTTVTVVALPSITSFTASSTTINYGQTATLTPVFTAPSGSTATIGTTGAGSSDLTATVTSGSAVSTGALTANTTFTLTVTNAAGDSVTKTAAVTVTQRFGPASSMSIARAGQTTTELPDGSVLVAGGTGAADKAEIYTPATGAFTATASAMQTARKNHTATLLANGKVLLTGGSDGANTLTSAELFDPSNGSFTATTGSMTHARQNHAAALLSDGRVLLLGGSNPTDHQLASAEIFDPATGSFTALSSSLVQAREFAIATALPTGDILVTGGTGAGATPLGTAELYSNGAFGAQSFAMRSARTRHTATLLPSGQVLLSGGFDGFTRLQSAELYTGGSTNSSFTPVTGSLAMGREQHTATLLTGGKVLLSGGSDGTAPLASAELFDPTAQTFTSAGTLATARFGAGASLLQTGKVLLLGGTGATATPLSSAELFDPQDSLTPDLSGAALTAPSTAAFASSQTASVTVPTGAFAIWTIENGTLTSGAGSANITFTTGSTGNTTVHVLVVTKLGLPILFSQVVTGH